MSSPFGTFEGVDPYEFVPGVHLRAIGGAQGPTNVKRPTWTWTITDADAQAAPVCQTESPTHTFRKVACGGGSWTAVRVTADR